MWGTEHRAHLVTLDAESENLDAALRWAAGQAAGPALELCDALGTYWLLRNRNSHALEWTDRVLGLADADAHPQRGCACFAPRRGACFRSGSDMSSPR